MSEEKKDLNMAGSVPPTAAWVPPNRGPELTMSQLEEQMKNIGVGSHGKSSPNDLSAQPNSAPMNQPGFYPGNYPHLPPQGWNIPGPVPSGAGVGGFGPHPQMSGASYPYSGFPPPGYENALGFRQQAPPLQGWNFPHGQPPPTYPGYFGPGIPPYGHLPPVISPEGWSPSNNDRKSRRRLKPVIVDKSDVDSDYEGDMGKFLPVEKEKEKKNKDKDKSSKSKKKNKEKRDSSGEHKGKEKDKKKKSEKKTKEKKTSMTPKPVAIVQRSSDLPQSFGKPKKLGKSDTKYRTIEKYVKNGSHADGSRVEVKVHQILDFGVASPSSSTTSSRSSNKLLLWWKTSPGSVRRLAQQKDGCIAFYDMITRAYAISPRQQLGKPLRQTMLLCSVSLGRMHNSPHGYKFWSGKEFPQGSDSVKGVGRFTPDRADDRDDNSSTIPCGEAVEHGQYKTYELDYNEYMIYEARRAKVKYAVDVELIPLGGSSESGSESE